MWPWFWPGAAFAAFAPSPCGPLRLTFAAPAPAFGPFAAFAPLWALAWDPGRNPWIAAGISVGPFAFALRWSEGGG